MTMKNQLNAVHFEIGNGRLDIVIRNSMTGAEIDRLPRLTKTDVDWLTQKLKAAAALAFEENKE